MKPAAEFEVLVRNVRDRRAEFEDRLIRNLKAVPHELFETPCMIYQGARNNNGYARLTFWVNGRSEYISAHRLFMMLMLKAPIPEDREVGHLCHIRACCSHLQLMTRTENLADRKRRRATGAPFYSSWRKKSSSTSTAP